MSKYTNDLGLSNAVAKAIMEINEEYDSCGWMSVTGLINPPRVHQLKKRHNDEITEDVADLIWSFFGHMGHLIAERNAGQNVLAEQRFVHEIDGKEISFKPDRLEKNVGSIPATWTLRDFKITSVYVLKDALKGFVKDEWEKQMNLYVYMLRKEGFTVSSIKLEIIARDWRKGESLHSYDYPKHQTAVVDVPIWSEEKQEAYLKERMKVHLEAESDSDEELSECTHEERWATHDEWAVVKKDSKPSGQTGLKKALKRAGHFRSNAEAEAFINAKIEKMKESKSKNPKPETLKKLEEAAEKERASLEVEFRKGTSKRCEDYCTAKPFCNQYREQINPAF